MNTVVETAEQTRQSFRPKQPRVAIDMSYVQDEPQFEPTADKAGDHAPPVEGPATKASAASTLHSTRAAERSAPADDGTQQADDDLPSYEDALTELAALRELADVFEGEFDKEVTARTVVEAERDEARRLAAKARREAEEALAALRERSDELTALSKVPASTASPESRSRIDELETTIKQEQESRLAVLEQLESTRQQLREAKEKAERHRNAALQATATTAALVATPPSAMQEQLEHLKADFQAELIAEQSARRATEAQRDLAERRIAAANREVEALRAAASKAAVAIGLEDELSAAKAVSANLVRELDEAKSRIATLKLDSAARDKANSEAIAAVRRDADTHRSGAEAAMADLKAAKDEHAALAGKFDEATKRISELQDALASRENSTGLALAAVQNEAAAQRDLVQHIEAELVEEYAARAAADAKLAEAAKTITDLQRASDALAGNGDMLVQIRREADALRSRAAELEVALADAMIARGENEAELARTTSLVAELQSTQAQQSNAIACLAARAEAAEAANQNAKPSAESQQRIAELEEALAEATTTSDGIEAELAQATFRLTEMQSKLAHQSETIDRLEAQNLDTQALADEAEADTQIAEAAVAAMQRIADLEHEIEAQRDAYSRAIDAALQDSAAQRALADQLAAELMGEKAALDEVAAQLGEAKLRSAEMQRDRETRARTVDAMSSLRDSVGAIPPKAIAPSAAPALVQPPSKVPPTARIDTLPEPVATVRAALTTEEQAPLLARAQAFLKPNAKPTSETDGSEGRRERRTAAQSPATVWREGMSQAVNCTIKNRSSGGALLEFPASRHVEEVSEFSIGDEVTLTFTSYRERSSVHCVVARVEGRTCGVKFAGQFHVQLLKPHKPKKVVGKPELAKVGR